MSGRQASEERTAGLGLEQDAAPPLRTQPPLPGPGERGAHAHSASDADGRDRARGSGVCYARDESGLGVLQGAFSSNGEEWRENEQDCVLIGHIAGTDPEILGWTQSGTP